MHSGPIQGTPESGENSVEFRVLLTYGPQLSLAIRADLTTLSGKLVAVRLITVDNSAELRNPMHTEAQRANRLVELVQISVQNNPQNYHKFIGVLAQDRAFYGHTLNQLQETYRSIQGQ